MMAWLQSVPPPIWLPVTACAVLLWLASRLHRGDRWHPGKVIVAIYFAVSLASLAFDQRLAPTFEMHLTWPVMSGYALLLCLTLVPALLIRRPDPQAVSGSRALPLLAIGSRPFIVFAALYLAPWAYVSLARGSAATREVLNVAGQAVLPETAATTVAVATASFYVLFAILLFVSLGRCSGPLRSGIAALGVALAAIHAAVFGARDGFFWLAQAILVAHWAVGGSIPQRVSRRLALIGMVVAAIGVFYLVAATRDRFSDAAEGYASGTLGYFGSQPYVFSETVARLSEFYGPALRFPIVAQALGVETVQRTEPFQWSFGSFLTDFYGVAGWSSAIWLSVLFAVATLAALRWCWRKSAFAYTLIVAVYVQFMIQGVFYYRLGSRSGNLYHLSFLLLIGAITLLFPDPVPGRLPGSRRAVHQRSLKPVRGTTKRPLLG